MIDHVGVLDRATNLPISVDLENGHGPEPESRGPGAVTRAAEAGPVGGSIEDYAPGARPLRLRSRRREGRRRVRSPARRPSFPFTFTARAENHIRGNPDIDDTVARLQAYEPAGADVLYAPGLRQRRTRSGRCATRLASRSTCWRILLPDAGRDRGRRRAEGQQREARWHWVAAGAMAAAAEQMRDAGDFSALPRAPSSLDEWLGEG